MGTVLHARYITRRGTEDQVLGDYYFPMRVPLLSPQDRQSLNALMDSVLHRHRHYTGHSARDATVAGRYIVWASPQSTGLPNGQPRLSLDRLEDPEEIIELWDVMAARNWIDTFFVECVNVEPGLPPYARPRGGRNETGKIPNEPPLEISSQSWQSNRLAAGQGPSNNWPEGSGTGQSYNTGRRQGSQSGSQRSRHNRNHDGSTQQYGGTSGWGDNTGDKSGWASDNTHSGW